MLSSSIENVKIPVLIPFRGKGHFETLCMCSFSSLSEFVNPADYIQHILPYGKQTLTSETPLHIAKTLQKAWKLSSYELSLQFHLPLDRTSVSYEGAYFSLPCTYLVRGTGRKVSLHMSVVLPIRVADNPPVAGDLTLEIRDPSDLFFEDLVDHVQKSVGVLIYPIQSEANRLQLREVIDSGKTPYEYLTALEEASVRKKLGKGGTALVQTTDVYHMYGFNYHIAW